MHSLSCLRFWGFAAVGICLLLCLSSLVVVTGPLALAGVALLLRRGGQPRDGFGVVSGLGLACLLVAYLNRGPGSLDAVPWLAAGGALLIADVVGFSAARR